MNYRLPAIAAVLAIATSGVALAQSSPMPMGSMAPMAPAASMPFPTASTGPAMTVKLGAQNGSGETATAVLTPVDGGITAVVTTKDAPPNPQPIHIHKGTCATLDPKPAYPLTLLKDGKSMTFVKGVTLADLMASPYAINIHKSPTEAAIYVACGDIKK